MSKQTRAYTGSLYVNLTPNGNLRLSPAGLRVFGAMATHAAKHAPAGRGIDITLYPHKPTPAHPESGRATFTWPLTPTERKAETDATRLARRFDSR